MADELERKLHERADLARRIAPEDAATLVRDLRRAGELVPRLPEPYRSIGRDRKDDYLIAHALIAHADYLVSWDKDLRDIREV